jgi:hypothetical protein
VRLVLGALEIDRFGWGTAAMAEGGAAAASPPIDEMTQTYERKAVASSTAASMEPGGADEARGNGHDTNDNAADFVHRTGAGPQNAASPAELP